MLPKLIHVGQIDLEKQGACYLFLRELSPYRYVWFLVDSSFQEKETPLWGATTEEALLAARQEWTFASFRSLKCGFRYTLPERDEVGTPALFWQMAASYASLTGIYFDEELGCNCIVQNASIAARLLWKRLEESSLPPLSTK